jgi:RNase H-fold protein (predicted Holliday junction resolvase)
MSVNKTLTHFLTTPHRIASSLDWKKLTGSVLAMNITSERIGLCLSPHPTHGEAPVTLQDIPLKLETRNGKRVVSSNTMSQLQDLVQQNKVCGILVGWPVQENGRLGAPCGKVLHALDSLVANSQVLTPNRPFCLWDGLHVEEEISDSFGRLSSYGKKYDSPKMVHVASEEQYVPARNLVACDIWNDFCRTHWPELYIDQGQREDFTLNYGILEEKYGLEDDHREQLHATYM